MKTCGIDLGLIVAPMSLLWGLCRYCSGTWTLWVSRLGSSSSSGRKPPWRTKTAAKSLSPTFTSCSDPKGPTYRNLEYTWTPKVCRIMAFWALFGGFGLLSYILLGFRYTTPQTLITMPNTEAIGAPSLDILNLGKGSRNLLGRDLDLILGGTPELALGSQRS